MVKFKPYAIGESVELKIDLEDYLPSDHLCRHVEWIVSELDTTSLECSYSVKGQHAFHPKMMLSIIFYGYTVGIRSGGKLEKACKEDLAFIYLSKSYQPRKTSINEFRRIHHPHFEGLFKQLLTKCIAAGLVDADKDIIDGSKIAANSAMKRTKTQSKYEKWLGHLKEDIQQIEQELSKLAESDTEQAVALEQDSTDEAPIVGSTYTASESIETLSKRLATKQGLAGKIQDLIKQLEDVEEGKKLNLTDPDAPIMKGKKGHYDTFYNTQIACDKNQLITYCDVVIDQNDKAQLVPTLKGIAENTKRAVKVALADADYNTFDALEYMEQQGIDGYTPYQHMNADFSEKPYHKANFTYNEQQDIYICPAGKQLSFYRQSVEKKTGQRYNNYRTDACLTCPFNQQCISSSRKRRVIQREVRQYLRDQMKQKLNTPEGKKRYQERFHPVEAIFGQMKYNLGYQQFLLRGLQKVKAEFTLMCIAHNLRKTMGQLDALLKNIAQLLSFVWKKGAQYARNKTIAFGLSMNFVFLSNFMYLKCFNVNQKGYSRSACKATLKISIT